MEEIKHECGIAMIRLLKPLEYYHEKYGTWTYALNKLYLLMEKQHNRGQEGAGLACVKLNAPPGEEYMFRERAVGTGAITEIFNAVYRYYKGVPGKRLNDPLFAGDKLPFAGELYMGHLRYSTTGKSGLSYIHPFLRRNNWKARNLVLCGNFNMTNVARIFHEITSSGQHPRHYADTYIVLEQLGHRLDREVEHLYRKYEAEGLNSLDITRAIEANIDLTNVIEKAASSWDGGYIICGITGSGESFVIRDPWGIRTAFYYASEDIVVTASERPVIQTVMDVPMEEVRELQRGEAMFISRKGGFRTAQILEPEKLNACSFERIYFSRGSDMDIYRERKMLGANLVEPILKAVDYDLEHTVFSFIPNTAEVAYCGMLEGLNSHLNRTKAQLVMEKEKDGKLDAGELNRILSLHIRSEKVALKDIKLRTFITEGHSRNDLAAHVYDVTYGSIVPGEDSLVVIDDSIVRGTTLRQSIIRILDRLHPKKIVIASSSPQVRYPDCYGIDMSSLSEFIAFKAAIELLKDRGMGNVIEEAYHRARKQAQQKNHNDTLVNYVKKIYAPFTDEEISARMVKLLTGDDIRAEVEIVYQDLNGLHAACPGHPGDWYFSGNYPTPGGARMVNNAFIRYVEEEYGREGDGKSPNL
ncbi:MAG: amidophosphoribosyltransferase [Tannerella sp.]|jgi:amidophosphoribosyltransferase|nr:amidophosphoribosyltransferase [Tannerella sp.]